MNASETAKVVSLLQEAIVILSGQSVASETARNPEWFRETGHLSDKGIEHLNDLFAAGKSTYAAAKAMGISYRATYLRHEAWRNKRA